MAYHVETLSTLLTLWGESFSNWWISFMKDQWIMIKIIDDKNNNNNNHDDDEDGDDEDNNVGLLCGAFMVP